VTTTTTIYSDLKSEKLSEPSISYSDVKSERTSEPSIEPSSPPAYVGYVVPNVQVGISQYLHQHPWIRALGVWGTLSYYWDEKTTTYNVWIKCVLPGIFGSRAFVSQITVRHFSYGGELRILRGFMMLRNIVPESSPIMEACSRGDLEMVRGLFKTRAACPHDMTPDDLSPLFVSQVKYSCAYTKMLTT
jgi:hypothetical protein